MKRIYVFLLISIMPHLASAQDIQHECGLALVRLFKPIAYYQKKYGSYAWGIHTLRLLMEKQRNRGQDSVGISVMQFGMPPEQAYMKRLRSTEKNALEHLFTNIDTKLLTLEDLAEDVDDMTVKQHCSVVGELYLGHVRYATYAGRHINFAQPCIYRNSIPAKCLTLAGNFNMTNSSEIMQTTLSYGLAPSSSADTHLIMHQISYWLDKAYEKAFASAIQKGSTTPHASHTASRTLDITSAVRQAAAHWDGGYVFGGMVGNGDAFLCRDPAGIRPGYYYVDEEFFAAASERSALMSVLNVSPEKIKAIPPAHLLIIKKDGTIEQHPFTDELPACQCVFERVYFSRPNDPDIYQERKKLGNNLASRLFKELGHNTERTVFSYIPNTSEISFHGLIEELNKLIFQRSYDQVLQSGIEHISNQEIIEMMRKKITVEKLVFKDQAIRTFIAHDAIRSNLVGNVYDVTKGVITDQDTLVVLDDSIVRGTTLRESIMKQLITLNPKKIIILSAAPIILYPDCYGIDMSQIGRLIGFQAAIALTKERDNQRLLDDIYQECVALKENNTIDFYNPVKKIYDQFTQHELEEKIGELIYPHTSTWKNKLQVFYQTIDGLHRAIPDYTGDWYFTGNYPTAGGYKIVINSYINWYTSSTKRAY
jgi:amidophosphoribosyltransferase